MGSGQIITDYLARGSGPPSDPPSLGASGQWALYQDTATGLYYQWNLQTSAWVRLAAGSLTQTVPSSPQAGDVWYSEDDGIDYYDGSVIQTVANQTILDEVSASLPRTIGYNAPDGPRAVTLADVRGVPAQSTLLALSKNDANSNAITYSGFTPDGGPQQTINGQTTYVLSKQYQSVTLTPDGTGNWVIVAAMPGIG